MKINKLKKPIYVTQPALPPLEEFIKYLKQIWENKIITNNGPFHQRFEKELAEYLGVKHISLFTNGTLALITALQALHITGEVITTPFSFVATTHSLWWNNIKPIFADIESGSFNLDPEKVEAVITPRTTAIMPVHVYGTPCNVKKFQRIADAYHLKLIYDAAHAFGVKINGQSVLNFGDLSILSFHATKAFNTIEGGAIISPDKKTKKQIDYLKNFGFADEVTVVGPGINAKMNELQAAYGLLQLKYVDKYIVKRRVIAKIYQEKLKNTPGISLLKDIKGIRRTYPYFPILIDTAQYGRTRDEVYTELKKHNIFCRRYFYPLISQFPTYKDLESAQLGKLPIAERVSKQVLCLPIYPDLDTKSLNKVINLLKKIHDAG